MRYLNEVKVDIDELKMAVTYILDDDDALINSSSLSTIKLYNDSLQQLQTVAKIFYFLKLNHFIGYLNYGLLKDIVDHFVSPRHELVLKLTLYEQQCTEFMGMTSFRNLMPLFGQYPELSPATTTGLPEILFKLSAPWPDRPVSKFQEKMGERFNWFKDLVLKDVTPACILVTLVLTHPSLFRKILQDLCNPETAAELSCDGISVVISEGEKKKILYFDRTINDMASCKFVISR